MKEYLLEIQKFEEEIKKGLKKSLYFFLCTRAVFSF